jgi:hypothetical protein
MYLRAPSAVRQPPASGPWVPTLWLTHPTPQYAFAEHAASCCKCKGPCLLSSVGSTIVPFPCCTVQVLLAIQAAHADPVECTALHLHAAYISQRTRSSHHRHCILLCRYYSLFTLGMLVMFECTGVVSCCLLLHCIVRASASLCRYYSLFTLGMLVMLCHQNV